MARSILFDLHKECSCRCHGPQFLSVKPLEIQEGFRIQRFSDFSWVIGGFWCLLCNTLQCPGLHSVTSLFHDTLWSVGTENANVPPAVLVSSAAEGSGQVMLCCQVSDEQSISRDFGFVNCSHALSLALRSVRVREMRPQAEVRAGSQQWSQSLAPGSGIWVGALRPEYHRKRILAVGIWEDCVWRAGATAVLVRRQFWTTLRVQGHLLPSEAAKVQSEAVFKSVHVLCEAKTELGQDYQPADTSAELIGPPCLPEIEKPFSPASPLWVRI